MATEGQVIGRNVRRLRQARGWRQEDLAARIRPVGAPWTQTTVSSVETGVRACSYVELAIILEVFGARLAELFAGDDEIERPDGQSVPLAWLRRALTRSGAGPPLVRTEQTGDGGWVTRWEFPPHDDATIKASRALGVDAGTVHSSARALWGASLADRRDQLLGDVTNVPARTVQARRGHITRQLLAELRDHLQEG